MLRSLWKIETTGEALMPITALSIFVLWIVMYISDIRTVQEFMSSVFLCEGNGCERVAIYVSIITAAVSIIGTIIVVITLVRTVRSSNRRDIQHQEQVDRMAGQIKILTQNNRMKFLKEYMTALSIRVYNQVDTYYEGKGIRTVDDEEGVIFVWNTVQDDNDLDYKFCVAIRFFSVKSEDVDEILKDKFWWTISIEIIRLNFVSYVMTGYAKSKKNSYKPIEKEFRRMSKKQYNHIMLAILSITAAERDNLEIWQGDYVDKIKD